MTTKKLIKELMAMGVSRNAARKVQRIAREHRLSNVDIWHASCDVILSMLEAGLGIAAKEVDDGEL